MAPLATLLGTVLGTALGLVMGYFRGAVDDVVGRFVEAFLALPLVVTGILGVVALGTSNTTLIVVIGIVFTPLIARTVRAAVLHERELDYVAAARLRGESSLYIMFAEILPNVMAPIVVEFTVRLGYAVFTIVTLSFLGFGLQPPSPNWGSEISNNYGLVTAGYWWEVLFDALAIALAGHRGQPDRQLDRDHAGRLMSATTATRARRRLPGDRRRAALSHVDISYRVRRDHQRVVRDVSFHVAKGESFGLVGESGCGKSTIALAIVRYLARNGRVSGGTIEIDGTRRPGARPRRSCAELRARKVSMVYQEPGRALNPSILVGRQVAEVYEIAGARPQGGAGARRRRCSPRSRSPTRRASWGATRTSSRAGCSSGS